MDEIILPKFYIELELAYINAVLPELPEGSFGRHYRGDKETEVVRLLLPEGRKEILKSRAPQDLVDSVELRTHLLARKKYLHNLWKKNYKGNPVSETKVRLKKLNRRFNGAYFKNAQGQGLAFDSNECIKHGEYWMRSRAEVSIAKDLEAMGLQYKYEVSIPETDQYADFLVYLEALDCCFFIEFFGKADDMQYMVRNIPKISNLMKDGYRLNHEIAMLWGTKKLMPTRKELAFLINQVILNLYSETVEPIG